jgi:hypothetical protein
MGGRGRNIPGTVSSYQEKPFSPADVASYLDAGSFSDTMLNMMGEKTFSAPVDSPGLSATKEALANEYRNRFGTDPDWGK